MIEFAHIPGKPLSNFVKYMWYQEGYNPSSSVERALPNGSSRIIINLGENRFRYFDSNLDNTFDYDDLILSGVHSRPVFLDSFTRRSTINIVLKEGAIPALFRIPATEFRNKVVSLHDLPTENTSDLKEKLLAASQPKERILITESYLFRLLDPGRYSGNPAVSATIGRIHQTHGRIDISEIAEQTGYTRRWFIKLFRDTVGTTPKQFAKICRFQHVLDVLRKETAPNFAEVALECGYYDQSHFIHDFKEFGGISPLDYHRNQGKDKNHLVLQTA